MYGNKSIYVETSIGFSVLEIKTSLGNMLKTLSASHCMGLKRIILEILAAVINSVVVQSWSKETIMEERIRRCHKKLCSY